MLLGGVLGLALRNSVDPFRRRETVNPELRRALAVSVIGGLLRDGLARHAIVPAVGHILSGFAATAADSCSVRLSSSEPNGRHVSLRPSSRRLVLEVRQYDFLCRDRIGGADRGRGSFGTTGPDQREDHQQEAECGEHVGQSVCDGRSVGSRREWGGGSRRSGWLVE